MTMCVPHALGYDWRMQLGVDDAIMVLSWC